MLKKQPLNVWEKKKRKSIPNKKNAKRREKESMKNFKRISINPKIIGLKEKEER